MRVRFVRRETPETARTRPRVRPEPIAHYRPSRCKYHRDRVTFVSTQFGEGPIEELCFECWDTADTRYRSRPPAQRSTPRLREEPANWSRSKLERVNVPTSTLTFPCPDCGAKFGTVQGLTMHRVTVHGYRKDRQ